MKVWLQIYGLYVHSACVRDSVIRTNRCSRGEMWLNGQTDRQTDPTTVTLAVHARRWLTTDATVHLLIEKRGSLYIRHWLWSIEVSTRHSCPEEVEKHERTWMNWCVKRCLSLIGCKKLAQELSLSPSWIKSNVIWLLVSSKLIANSFLHTNFLCSVFLHSILSVASAVNAHWASTDCTRHNALHFKISCLCFSYWL